MATAKNITLRALAAASAPMSFADVSEITGLSTSTQSTTLWRMRLDGFVERNGKKVSLTARGKALAEALPETDEEEEIHETASEAAAPMDFAAWFSGDLTIYSPENDTTVLLSASEVKSLADFIATSTLRNVFADALKAPHERFATRDELYEIATGVIAELSAPPCPPAPDGSFCTHDNVAPEAARAPAPPNKFGHLFTPPPGPAPTEPTGLVNPDAPQ